MCSYHIAGRPDGIRWWWPACWWGRQTGCGGGVCHGQEVAVKANAGDSDASGGIWISEDGGVPRGGYLKGLIYLKYCCLLVWVEQNILGAFCHWKSNGCHVLHSTGHTVIESQDMKWKNVL